MPIREMMVSATDFKLMGLERQVLTLNTTLTLTSQEKPGPVGRKKSSTSHWDGGVFVKTDSNNFGPLRSLSVAKKDSYPLEVNAHYCESISQRSGWTMFQIRATCTVGAMGVKL